MNSHIVNLIESSEQEEIGSSFPRRVVSLLMLALAGYCFWQGGGLFVWEDSARTIAAVASQTESAVVPDALPITQIDVGDWVFAASNPSARDEESSSVSAEVDSSTWRLMVLEAYKPNGQPMEVQMLRPLAWLQQQNAQPGKNIYIASKELGFFGDMLVKEIHACPQLMPRPGPGYEVVTATFRHQRADVIDLTVQDLAQPIGTTPNHPFWSEDRQAFTPAGDLEIGEKLRLANGNLTYVTKTTPRPGTHWVYNLEVNTQHVYHVSNAGLLVHNSNACGGVVPQRAYQSGRRMADSQLLRRNTNTSHTRSITEWRRSISRNNIRNERIKFLDEDAVKIDTGTWRSLDGTRQFRTVPSDYLGQHGIGQPTVPNTPHVHFEFLALPNPGGSNLRVLKNVHVPLN